MNKELWALEYSEKQQQFHVNRADIVMITNLKRLFQGPHDNDWVMLGLFDTIEQAHEFRVHVTEVLRRVKESPHPLTRI